MGKKTKIGKQRKDRFYQLAKETGYRSRAAFKLIQLNRKYEFLQKSRVLVDLCAAPGGWLQVAKENMPVSSIIIGVDLVSIRPLPNVTTIEEDITTGKCRQEIKKHLKTWKADTILHDGAPNVGKNWLHDAFQQAQLTLQALRLATSFLAKGGWFVTKVFRSKDYLPLMWVFKELFKKVYATKPQASRMESAEIFVVCQHYLAPDTLDPRYLDPKYVFNEVDPEPKVKLNLVHPEKQKKRAEGYKEGDTTLFHRVPVSEFVTSRTYVELLNDCNELHFDDDRYANSVHTTKEMKECCKDIKVLGRKELRMLLSWRKKLQEEFHPKPESESKDDGETPVVDEETLIQNQIEEAQLEERRELRRIKKKVVKERLKLQEKMNLKMVLPNDEPVISEDLSLFQLRVIKNKQQLAEVGETDLQALDAELDERANEKALMRKTMQYDKDDGDHLQGLYSSDEEEEDDDDESLESFHGADDDDEGEDEDEVEPDTNPLVVDLDESSDNQKKKRKMDMWFGKDIFSGIEKDEDEKYEMEQIINYFDGKGYLKGSKKLSEATKETQESDVKTKKKVVQEIKKDSPKKTQNGDVAKAGGNQETKSKKRTLDVEGLALGTLFIHSKKQRRDIIDDGWNRYTFQEDNLPDWFTRDEAKFNKKQLPVSKDLVEEYKQKLKEINARPIKKVAEAKARKKRKLQRKMEKARKRVEAVTESLDLTEGEKRQQIKSIYKKAEPNTNKEVTYVVAKKGAGGRRVRRPAGVKGHFKVVDPRMKKDDRQRKAQDKQSRKGKGRSNPQKKGGNKERSKKRPPKRPKNKRK